MVDKRASGGSHERGGGEPRGRGPRVRAVEAVEGTICCGAEGTRGGTISVFNLFFIILLIRSILYYII